jgi:hypothetical protein
MVEEETKEIVEETIVERYYQMRMEIEVSAWRHAVGVA